MTLRVGYLTSRMPYPPYSGGQRHEYEVIRRLARRARIQLFVVSQFPDDCEGIAEMERHCERVVMLPAARAAGPQPDLPGRVWKQACPAMYKELDERLRSDSIDLMHVEGYYMLQHLAARPQVPTVLKEENIEFLLDRQRENLGFHDDAPWQIAEQLEREAWSRVDLCATISRDDLHRISTIAPDVPVALSPQGSDQAVVRPDDLERDGPVAATLFGCYSYPPTEDAAMHLLNEVWPLVLDALGEDLELRLVGTAPTPRMREAANGMPHVKIVGRVPAVADAYRGGDIALAPLRIGGGVKMKIVEAISHGCAVVATNLAAEGLPSPVRAALLLGDDPQTLARHIAALAADPALRRWRAQACLEASRVMPSWDEAAECLWSIWTHCMRGSEPALALNSGESNA